MRFRVRRLRLGAPLFLFQKIALIKLLLRLWSQVRIGVRAVGKQNQRANREEEALQGKTSTAINKAYELTTTYTTSARNT
jgi:hypothetical protein